MEEQILHLAVLAAEEDGLTPDETAAGLGVPIAVIHHHLSDDYAVPPLSRRDKRHLAEAVWAHDPQILRDQWTPFAR